MRVPGRLRIAWEDDTTLKIETDAGQQTRLLHFDKSLKPPARADVAGAFGWPSGSHLPAGRAGRQHPAGAAARRVAQGRDDQSARGLPAQERRALQRRRRRHRVLRSRLTCDGSDWLTVLTVVDDPRYLTQPFITSTHFKREPDGSKWTPTPCE